MSGERRLDPRTGAMLILAPDGLTIEPREGGNAFIAAPRGYFLSHFGDGATVVGQGEAPVDGWWDWHFEVDVEGGRLRRLGPAY